MPVTLISSPVACGRADQLPGVAMAGQAGGLAALGALADLVPEAQREHSEHGGAPAEVVSVFVIERSGVVAGLGGRSVGFCPPAWQSRSHSQCMTGPSAQNR
jgi:hypothetical protein